MKHEFQSFEEQLNILKSKKKVVFLSLEDEENLKEYLKRYNYINVINPYKIYFFDNKIDGNHIYNSETNYTEYISFFKKDIEYSFDILKHVLFFEKYLGTTISYRLSNSLSSNSKYFEVVKEESIKILKDKRRFDNDDININYYSEDFQRRLELLKYEFSETDMFYFKKAYNIMCFEDKVRNDYKIDNISENDWFYNVNFMSFEDVLFLFKILNSKDQNLIIKEIIGKQISIIDFNKVTRNIKKLRNKLAHFENLTVVINKQFDTDENVYIKSGTKAINTIKNVFIYQGLEIPEYVNEIDRLYKFRLNKYRSLCLI